MILDILKDVEISKKDLEITIKKMSKEDFNDNCDYLIQIVFNRSNLDEISCEILNNLNSNKFSLENLERIKKMFYLNPINFLSKNVYKIGFEFDKSMAIEVIGILKYLYDDSLYEIIKNILKPFMNNDDDILMLLVNNLAITNNNNNSVGKKSKLSKVKSFIISGNEKGTSVKEFSEKFHTSPPTYFFKKFIIEHLKYNILNLEQFIKLIYFYLTESDTSLTKLFIIKFWAIFNNSKELLGKQKYEYLIMLYKNKKFKKYHMKLGVLIYKYLNYSNEDKLLIKKLDRFKNDNYEINIYYSMLNKEEDN